MGNTITDLEKEIVRVVGESERRLTPQALETRLSESWGLTRKIVRRAIRDLVDEGALEYTSTFGCSFIEPSFNRPVRISPHVVIKPEETRYEGHPDDVVLSLLAGVSFGTGRHPTTCLCVRAVEHVMSSYQLPDGGRVLDIGTGSGILSMVAASMGLLHVEATDYDENARFEARKNAAINGLKDRIVVSEKSLEEMGCVFSLVMANLRFPTLYSLCPSIAQVSLPGAFVVLSGIRREELPAITSLYISKGFDEIEGGFEKGWSSLICQKAITPE